MKSLKYGIVFSALLLVVTGCGGEAKTLKCKTDEEALGNQEVSIDFAADGTVENMDMRMFMDYGVELAEEDLAPICEQFNTQDGVTCEASSEGTSVTVDVLYDFAKVSDDVKDELVGTGQDYDLVKEQFETLGYTCE